MLSSSFLSISLNLLVHHLLTLFLQLSPAPWLLPLSALFANLLFSPRHSLPLGQPRSCSFCALSITRSSAVCKLAPPNSSPKLSRSANGSTAVPAMFTTETRLDHRNPLCNFSIRSENSVEEDVAGTETLLERTRQKISQNANTFVEPR